MRLRIFLAFVLVVIISTTGVVLLARQGVARELNAYMFRGGMYGVENIVSTLEDYYRQNGSWDGIDALLPMARGMMGKGQHMNGMMGQQRFRLADAQGTVIVDTAGSPNGKLSAAEREQSIQLEVNRKVVGYLMPASGVPFTASESEALLDRWNRAALVAALIGGVLSLLLALLLAYGLLRPVRALTRASAALSAGDLSQRVPARGSDEMALLARTFNQMAESLQHAEETRRALTADIAHELRTPLAVQRANIEAMQDGIFPLEPANLQPVLDQNLMLTRLVEDLRTLALADSGQLELERTPTELATLIQNVVERFTPSAATRRLHIFTELPEGPIRFFNLDPLRIEQILNNLLSNALRYTPDGGLVTCHLAYGEKVVFTIHDSGPGIPPEALPHVFDRFYRADKSRSRAEGGTGLGLAIARQLAEAHGGTLTAANHSQGGALFTLTLPAASPT
jgi:two-component system OmpR family sensor kinase/two-component system sensor histidine kinase BaeS